MKKGRLRGPTHPKVLQANMRGLLGTFLPKEPHIDAILWFELICVSVDLESRNMEPELEIARYFRKN